LPKFCIIDSLLNKYGFALHLTFFVLPPFGFFSNLTLRGIVLRRLYLFCFIVKNVEFETGLCLIADSLSENLNLNNSNTSSLKLKLDLFEIGNLINLAGVFPCFLLTHLLVSKKSL
jgi:hypothetical protein